MYQVKVEMGEQTVVAEFNDREIPAHNWHWVNGTYVTPNAKISPQVEPEYLFF